MVGTITMYVDSDADDDDDGVTTCRDGGRRESLMLVIYNQVCPFDWARVGPGCWWCVCLSVVLVDDGCLL